MSARVLFGLAALAATSLPSTALAQEQAPAASRRAADAATELALDAWRARHGDGWRARVEPGTGKARFLAGGALAAEAIPEEEGEWFALAERRVDEALPLFDVDPATLERVEVKHLDLVRIGTTDKTVVRFRQRAGGAPVRGGSLSALFGMDGELLALDSTCLPDADELDPEPFVPEAFALRLARARFELDEGVPAEAVDELELVVTRHEERGELRARLAWSIGLAAAPVRGDTRSRRVLVAADAEGGGVLESRSRVHRAVQQGPPGRPQVPQAHRISWARQHLSDKSGWIGTHATPGTEADWAGNPPVFEPLPFAWVTTAAGTATTTKNGRFVLPPSAAGTDTAAFRYQGPWVRVVNEAGPDSVLTALVHTGTPQLHLLNAPVDPLETAEANAFLRVGDMRRFVTGIDPSDATMDFQALAFVNASGTCNAFYYGPLVEFYAASGSCNNTAFSTVVAHEMGHWANDRYGSGNGPDGFGEGAADAWAMYIHDTQYLGEYFDPGGGWLRDGENTRQYCGDGNGGCYGEVHDDGEVLMGALWKVRRNLNNSLGDALGDLTADVLFLSWMQAFDDGQIHSVIEDHWIVLDDDDGDLSNGTPHFAEIDGAFVEQGFPGVAGPPPASVVVERDQIFAADGYYGDEFARAVALSGDTMIAGSRTNDGGGPGSGAAYVFTRTGTQWQQQAKLHNIALSTGDSAGWAVALDGDRAVVGAPSDDPLGSASGSVTVFERSGSSWSPTSYLLASDGGKFEDFGWSVALSGDTIAVGAFQAKPNSTGAVYVFERSGALWSQVAKLQPGDLDDQSKFGYSVALDGDTLVAGAPYYSVPGLLRGTAYVFVRGGSGWTQRQKLTAPGLADEDVFGQSVDIEGGWIVVSSPGDDEGGVAEAGSVHVFAPSGSTWTHHAKLLASNGSDTDYFGRAVAIHGNLLLVGSYLHDGTGYNSGTAYLFERSGGGWQEIEHFVAQDTSSGDGFGIGLDLEGTSAVVGAYGEDTQGASAGAAYSFDIQIP